MADDAQSIGNKILSMFGSEEAPKDDGTCPHCGQSKPAPQANGGETLGKKIGYPGS